MSLPPTSAIGAGTMLSIKNDRDVSGKRHRVHEANS